MIYKQPFATDLKSNWNKAIANAGLNLQHLEKIDKVAKDKREILYRNFSLSVADGKVFYQVTKVNKKTAVVKLCSGICLDDYADAVLGDESEISLAKVNEFLKRKDALSSIFG